MPMERVAMRLVRDCLRLKSTGVSTREIARRIGVVPRGDQGENPATIRMRTPMWADRREGVARP